MIKIILFEQLNSEYNGKTITTKAEICDVTQPKPVVSKAVFECKSCMRLYEVEQKYEEMREPVICKECGGKSFKLIHEKSEFKEIQYLTVTSENTTKQLLVLLTGINVSYDDYNVGDTVELTGTVKIRRFRNTFQLYVVCDDINLVEKNIEKTLTTDDRSSQEYKKWHKEIHNRDKVCQICGGHKHLEAHHLFGYKNNPMLRTILGNGVLLCSFCHNKFHSYYGKDVTPVDLIKFINQFGRV